MTTRLHRTSKSCGHLKTRWRTPLTCSLESVSTATNAMITRSSVGPRISTIKCLHSSPKSDLRMIPPQDNEKLVVLQLKVQNRCLRKLSIETRVMSNIPKPMLWLLRSFPSTYNTMQSLKPHDVSNWRLGSPTVTILILPEVTSTVYGATCSALA